MPSHPVVAWHTLSTEAVAEALATDVKRGLTGAEAARRLALHGTNRLAQKPPRAVPIYFPFTFINGSRTIPCG